MSARHSWTTWIAPALAGAVRVALGVLWLLEGTTKYHAHFGSADIRLVADSARGNSRVPEFHKAFASDILTPFADVFGVVVPLVEVGLGIALVLGVASLPAACLSVMTLMVYWLSDQLIGQYPVAVLLSAVVLVAPVSATRFSVGALIRRRVAEGSPLAPWTVGLRARWW
ncbi:DoxX family membrane protein [Xylanimonas allomyrinae]|uniref:DoxX family membrane protein n=1 Tax=Xylanimonas allomyrinae TaxID=2509459 RepID=A0A4P6EMU9_9MICO|nr:DoxX family membrane protein [Xylanimonas allomyrinae]QAY64002.1 DoxX family membrane protein [Xylanimonas allomyrinae]